MIKKIDNINIDGQNRAWGGYIYSLSYSPNFGEAPSELSVEVTNESGIFDIDKNDLTTLGNPVTITVGSKITLHMFPIEYQIEDSPSGKTLRVDYIDESIVYLDKRVVKLKTRGVTGESYINTIVVGTERARNAAVTEGVVGTILPGESPTGAEASNLLEVTDVDYTFPELLEKISTFINIVPALDAPATRYRRDYAGKLREVLSAWCNDLGLGFYWENRKLNFIDLRNPANLSAVEALAESVKLANNIQSNSYGHSLRDTYTKGVEVFFGKDGEVLQDVPNVNDDTTDYLFSNIRIRFSMDPSYKLGEETTLFDKRAKYAYYGVPQLLLNLALETPGVNSEVKDIIDTEEINDTVRDRITDGTAFYDSRTNYKWRAAKIGSKNRNIEQLYNIYSAYANFYGRFYWKKLPTLERAQSIFGQEGKFYDEYILLKNVDIFRDYLSPLQQFIEDYDTLTLREFIELNEGTPPTGSSLDAPTNGYLIMEIDPVWNPQKTEFLFDIGKYVIIEGSDDDTDFFRIEDEVRKPIFYFGVTSGESLQPVSYPSEQPITFTAQQTGGIRINEGGVAAKTELTTYSPPETANVNYYDFSSEILSEEQVLGASAYYYKNSSANQAAFTSAANDVLESTKTSQIEPFFSSTLTIPNIDLEGPSLSLGTGLLGFSVSIGANGVQTTYRFGNEKMRVRNSDVFYRYFYDPAKKKQELGQVPSIIIRRGRAVRYF